MQISCFGCVSHDPCERGHWQSNGIFQVANGVSLKFTLLYQVETKQLKRAVRRNSGRFPNDFMFELSWKEFENLRCQFGTSSWDSVRYAPLAFTEQGVAMLSSVLNSEHAISVNIQIMQII